jgi:phage terminase small subunit
MAVKNLREAFCLAYHALPEAVGRGARAAVMAGYSEKSAKAKASQLLADPRVKERLDQLDGRAPAPMPAVSGAHPSTTGAWPFSPPGTEHSPPPEPSPDLFDGLQEADPLAWLEKAMNNPRLDPKLRTDAAKALLPFKHAKLGEVGKKQQQKEKAGVVAGKFSPRAGPPQLKAV